MNILLVDDDQDSCRSVAEFLEELGHNVIRSGSADNALRAFRKRHFPLVITDICMPGTDGIDLLRELKAGDHAACDVLVYTGHGDMKTAIAALRLGAYDYLQKPVNVEVLAAIVDRCAEHQSLLQENRQLTTHFQARVNDATHDLQQELTLMRRMVRGTCGLPEMVYHSPEMKAIVDTARTYHTDASVPVVIEGDTGCGKELVARLIHFGDGAVDTPFVDINCAAIPGELFEAELFGYESGAFTGGKAKGEKGKLEIAGRGTLLLDEIGEMPLHMQPKLLRVLENRCFYPVGGLKKKQFLARVVCCTNRNLHAMVDTGDFRKDLYYRLNIGYIRIPPLRERSADIKALAHFFLKKKSARKRRRFKAIAPSAMAMLLRHDFPGNVRELENVIERAVLSYDDEVLCPDHLLSAFSPPPASSKPSATVVDLSHNTIPLPEHGLDLEQLNLAIVRKALARFNGNKSETSRYLGLSRRALESRVRKLDP